MEEAVPEGFFASCADETGGVPCLFQRMHHFLGERASAQVTKVQDKEEAGTPLPHWALATAGAPQQGAGQKSSGGGPWTY